MKGVGALSISYGEGIVETFTDGTEFAAF